MKQSERNQHLYRQNYKITRADRNFLNGHKSFVVWMTGLSGSGKSTVANYLEQLLAEKKIRSYILDGDNTRLGINKDLDFSDAGREENIRRVAELSKLMADAGILVITSFISPFGKDRKSARAIIGDENFVEIYVECPLEVCEARDVKGLYAKARKGEIKNFTGISSAFEAPENPEIIINTSIETPEKCAEHILEAILNKIKITANNI
jgi:adenylylsulfate kinase